MSPYNIMNCQYRTILLYSMHNLNWYTKEECLTSLGFWGLGLVCWGGGNLWAWGLSPLKPTPILAPERLCRYWDKLRHVRSFDTKTTPRISGKPYQILQGHLNQHCLQPTGYNVITYFRSEVLGENSRKCRLRRLREIFLEYGSS